MTLVLFSHFRKLEKRRKKSIILLCDSEHYLNDSSLFFLPLLNAWGCTKWPLAALWSEQKDVALNSVILEAMFRSARSRTCCQALSRRQILCCRHKDQPTALTLRFPISSLCKQMQQKKNKSKKGEIRAKAHTNHNIKPTWFCFIYHILFLLMHIVSLQMCYCLAW